MISSLTVLRRPLRTHLACVRRQLCRVTLFVVMLFFSGGDAPLLPMGKHAPKSKQIHEHDASLRDSPCSSCAPTHDHAHLALA